MAVDVTNILFTFGAIIAGFVAAAFVAKLTGTDSFIIAAIGHFLDILKMTFQFIIDHLPKPVRIILFIILFAALGGGIYSLTIGAQYVCYEDEVYQVDYVTGLASKLSSDQSAAKDYFQVDEISYTKYDCNAEGNQCNKLEYTAKQIDSVLGADNNVIQVITGEVVDGFGTFDTMYTLKPVAGVNDLNGYVGSRIYALSLEPREYAFRQFWNGENQAYNICYSTDYNTCMLLQKTNIGIDACGIDTASEIFTFGLLSPNEGGRFNGWTKSVGTIEYYLKDSPNEYNLDEELVFASIQTPRQNAFGDFLNKIALPWFKKYSVDDCQTYDSTDVVDAVTETIYGEGSINIESIDNSTGFVSSFPLYNAQWDLLMSVKVGDLDPITLIDNQDRGYNNAKEVAKLRLDRSKVVQKSSDIVKYYCTEDKQGTYMTVAGFNPFDKTVMLFIILISSILAIYRYTGANR